MRRVRGLLWTMLAALWLVPLALYLNATAPPTVRRVTIALPGYPRAAPPVRLLLMSDLHVAWPGTTPARLARVVAIANAARPDTVVIAGDLVGDGNDRFGRYAADAALAPLRALRAPLGVLAVLGNNDRVGGTAPARHALAAAGVTLLVNDARRVGGLAIGGLDDALDGYADAEATFAAMAAAGGVPVLVSHSPYVAGMRARATPLVPRLLLAGHTHCGQVILPDLPPRLLRFLPVAGRAATAKRLCGRDMVRGVMRIVTAGIGTSHLPFRFGAHPDMWLVTVVAPRP